MAQTGKADDINFLVNDVPGLTEEEKDTLISVMMKAKELDAQEENKMNWQKKPLEGQLYKYTNVVKGWQYRWFILTPDSGILEYYMLDEVKKMRPRGAVYLAGAVISPSDEDGQSFTISAACGEIYKLKANDAKERQFWVNRIRAVAEHHTKTIAEKNPPLPPREHRTPLISFDFLNRIHHPESLESHCTWYTNLQKINLPSPQEHGNQPLWKPQRSFSSRESSHSSVTQTASSVTEALNSVRDMLLQTEQRHNTMIKSIEILPVVGNNLKCCDIDLLLLKATSTATLQCLQHCYAILQHQQVAVNFPKAMIERRNSKKSNSSDGHMKMNKQDDNLTSDLSSMESSYASDPSGEITDDEDEVPDLPLTVEQHSVVMHLMSQMKLGTDLTKVVLPSFTLEPRSLLEMFADFMSHPDYFVRIPECSTPEERILAVLEWYLTSFYAGRKATVTKKPYNPIIGETFHCSWKINKCKDKGENLTNNKKEDDYFKVTYVAEQVSHHPPVSAFYVECPEKNMAMGAHICMKSNFLTAYVGVTLVGEVKLQLLNFRETYIFTLPSAYTRCILTVPWMELGGRVSLTCYASGYSAFVTFQTKPQEGGVPHRLVGEVKNSIGDIICRINGEWNGILQFTSHNGTIKTIDVNLLQKYRKYIRPISQQDAFESRKLWQEVTTSLRQSDYNTASFYKEKLENRQREEEKQRQDAGIEYQGQLFQKVNDIWEYKYPLPVCQQS